MSLFARASRGLRVRAARGGERERVLEYLERRPAENVFLSHLARRDGVGRSALARGWLLAESDGRLRGVLLCSANLLPAVDGEEASRALGRELGGILPGTLSVVGERAAVTALWAELRARAPTPRLVREEQPFYLLERDGASAGGASGSGGLRLRPAAGEDLDLLVQASADMLREEILDDPHARDPVAFRAQVWRMVQEGAIFVGEDRGHVVFKAHANVRTPLAAQISGVYTLPEHRGRGYARAGMRTLAQRLLAEHPRLCLYVNRDNAAAIHAYEAVGFRRVATFKSIFLEGGA
ncbi:MAG: GNAT family N-acetyltransferase [Gemmatimonadota bacterium]